MGTLNENIVQKKFESLQPTQENIETVSLWCLHHKDYHSMIVGVWIKCFKTGVVLFSNSRISGLKLIC